MPRPQRPRITQIAGPILGEFLVGISVGMAALWMASQISDAAAQLARRLGRAPGGLGSADPGDLGGRGQRQDEPRAAPAGRAQRFLMRLNGPRIGAAGQPQGQAHGLQLA